MNEIRCIFMGTPQIAATVLQSMLDANIHVGLVVTQPDKKVGRKQTIVYSPVKEVALKHDIPVFQPIRIKEDYQTILDYKPDVIVTCAYGQIVHDQILNAPLYGCVNLHGSILPAYRGGAPIQRAIWNGDTVSGMSLMKMVRRMDAGPVMAVETIAIEEEDNSSTLFEKMGLAASKLLIENFERICSDEATYIEQDESKVVYAPVISKEEEKINFQNDDSFIVNQIRALAMQPGAYGFVKNKKLKILKAHYTERETTEAGKIIGLIDGAFVIDLHKGSLFIELLQMEGKPVMSGKDFFNGQGRNLVGQNIE